MPKAIICGRADVILDSEGSDVTALAIIDDKTSTGDDPAANEEYDLQLAVYTDAGARRTRRPRRLCA